MLSHHHKCLFIHIPKTAGQSIEHMFLNSLSLSWEERAPLLLKYNPDPSKGPERLAHLTADEYVNCGYISPELFSRYFKFTFVRNPWDRLVSEYKYRGYDNQFSLDDFIRYHLPKAGMSDNYRHLIPQSHFFSKDHNVDFIGRFENLQDDFTVVAEKLGLETSLLPHVNASRNHLQAYQDCYTDFSRKWVADMYQEDISRFNYVY